LPVSTCAPCGVFISSTHLGGGLPIPYREIVLTARVIYEVFGQMYGGEAKSTGSFHKS
jgi:hypothetical protein